MEEWLSIAEIADKSGIPENTARRYVGKFSDFIQVKSTGRAKKYPPETIGVVERISQLYQGGKSTDEIYELLSREQPLVVEVEQEEQPSLSLTPYEVMEEFRRTNMLILQTMQQVSQAVESMTGQQQEINRLRQEVEAAKDQELQITEGQRKLEDIEKELHLAKDRERDLLDRLARIEEEQKKPWWKLWGK